MCATWLCPGKPPHPRLFENGSHSNVMLHDQPWQVKLRIPTMTPDAHRCWCLYKAIRWTKHHHEPVNIRTFPQGWSIVKSQFPVPLTYKDQTTRPAVLTLSSHSHILFNLQQSPIIWSIIWVNWCSVTYGKIISSNWLNQEINLLWL